MCRHFGMEWVKKCKADYMHKKLARGGGIAMTLTKSTYCGAEHFIGTVFFSFGLWSGSQRYSNPIEQRVQFQLREVI